MTYPVKLVKSFDVSFIFDYLLYPIACVYCNQVTRTSSLIGILMKALCFSLPMALVEHFFEKRTSLIKFKKGWNSLISFFSLTVTFLISRTFIAIIRKANNTPVPDNK
nr:CBO0543 family protein [Bacillus infantis]